MTNRKLRVFLCHSSTDKPVVRGVYKRLTSEGWIDPWLDEDKLLPGSDWNLETEKAIELADAVIVFLSNSSVTKEGYVQREIKYALDVALEKPEESIFIIPLRLEESPIPRTLRNIQWVDYFENKNVAYEHLIRSLQLRARKLAIKAQTVKATYDLDEVHKMLLDLSKDELQKLCFSELRSLYSRIDWQDYTFKAASEIVRAAYEQENILDILNWVEKNNIKIFKRYYSRITNSSRPKKKKYPKVTDQKRRENPYIPTKPLPENSKVFLGRLDIAKRIANLMRSDIHKPSFLLHGRRRMGKTSALYNLQSLMGDNKTIGVLFSGQSAKLSSDEGFCFNIVQETMQRIKDFYLVKKLFSGEEIFADVNAFAPQPVIMLERFFEKCYDFLERNDLYVLIMIDEYEEIGKNLSRQLLVQLRDTIQHARRYVFVFSGASLVDDLPNSAWFEVFVNVTTLKISFLERSDGYTLLTNPMPGISYENEALIGEILDLTGCQPFLIQCMAYEIVDSLLSANRFVVTQQDVDVAIDKIFSSRVPYFEGIIWRDECPTNRHKDILRIVAVSNNGVRISDYSDYKLEIEDLVRKDILRIENNIVKLCVPLIGLWIKKNKSY